MKKISEKEFRDYLEYKEFMGEGLSSTGKKSDGRLSLDQLDMVRAARGDREFEQFMSEMKARKEKEEK